MYVCMYIYIHTYTHTRTHIYMTQLGPTHDGQ